ncbi:MAG: hypothetical protein RLZZ15_1449 [Verrucomicrobiota bacterium]
MSELATVIATGANAAHFANLTMLLASWKTHHAATPLVVCDYGLTPEQAALLRAIPGLHFAAGPALRGTHAWEGKARLGEYVAPPAPPWEALVWIDADALFLRPLPALGELLAGYDVIVDAHVQSNGAIVHEGNLRALGLRADDAYFSSGFWIVRRGCLLESFARLAERVRGQGNLWENDAFVAAIYAEKLRVRTVSGGVWHARGKTSLHTCAVAGLEARHEGQPIYVVHANDGYTLRADGRRIFNRPELAAIQDHYEGKFWREVAPTSRG